MIENKKHAKTSKIFIFSLRIAYELAILLEIRLKKPNFQMAIVVIERRRRRRSS